MGTTSVRTIESLYYMGVYLLSHPEATEDDLHVNQWDPYELSADGGLVNAIQPSQAIQAIIDYLDRNGLEALHTSTQIIIAPGYQYKIVKMLITNSISLRALFSSSSVPSSMATGRKCTTMLWLTISVS